MPLKLNVGISKKIGLPGYGSLCASCHVEVELIQNSPAADPDGFQQKVKQAFVACRQAVQEELALHQPTPSHGSSPPRGPSGQSTGHGGQPRQATASQVRAIEAIAGKLQLDLSAWLQERYGLRLAPELSITQASESIDALKAISKPNGAPRR